MTTIEALRKLEERAAALTDKLPRPIQKPTRYEVSYLAGGNISRCLFTVDVEHQGNDQYAIVRHRCPECHEDDHCDWQARMPEPEYDVLDVLDGRRFDLETALTVARQAAAVLNVDGHSVTDVIPPH